MSEPLIYTTQGNVPEAGLTLKAIWEDTADYTKCRIQRFMGEELVREDVYILGRKQLEIVPEMAQL